MLQFFSDSVTTSSSLDTIGYLPFMASIKTYRKCLISCILAIYIYYQLIFIPFEFFINQNTKRLRKSAKFISMTFGYGLVFLVISCSMQPILANVLAGFCMLFCMIIMTIGFLVKIKCLITTFHAIGQVSGMAIGINVIVSGWVHT